jgi:hypothetical protein
VTPRILRPLVLAGLLVATSVPLPALAGTQADPVDCQIENLSPSVPVGAQATYVVHLFGGLGSYSVTMSYGDGASDTRGLSGPSTTFNHTFAAAGSYGQTANVSASGSAAACTSSTSVY